MQHKHTAQGLASLGRGPDTELVHMTKGEVHGLQKLAMAHGGTLTINPETGLAEAGFLSSLLPMVLGAGAMMIPGVGPMMAAGLVGGGYGLATGSLSKGLVAGLGAFGGASLGAGLMGAGAEGLATAAVPTVDAGAAMAAGAGDATANLAANATIPTGFAGNVSSMGQGLAGIGSETGRSALMGQMGGGMGLAKTGMMAAAPIFADLITPTTTKMPITNQGMIRPYTFNRTRNDQPDALTAQYVPGQSTRERQYFNDSYTAGTPYKAPGPEYMADGGIARVAPMNAKMAAFSAASDKLSTQQGLRDTIAAAKTGDRAALSALQGAGYDLNNLNTFADGGSVGNGPVDRMSNNNIMGVNTGYPMSDIYAGAYSTPDLQQPRSMNIVQGPQDASADPYTGQATFAAGGGISNLGGYSDGGQLLRGPGDGVSDSIEAQIGNKQPARLADGEFVVPARIVSELGNGSTEAGSRQLYAMMDRVQNARKKSIGKDKVATNSRAAKLLPA